MGNFIHANQRRYQISTEMKDEGKGGEDRVKKMKEEPQKKWKRRDLNKSGNNPKPRGI